MASPAEMARRYGPEISVPDWHRRLVCSRCGSRDTDMVGGECARRVALRKDITSKRSCAHIEHRATPGVMLVDCAELKTSDGFF